MRRLPSGAPVRNRSSWRAVALLTLLAGCSANAGGGQNHGGGGGNSGSGNGAGGDGSGLVPGDPGSGGSLFASSGGGGTVTTNFDGGACGESKAAEQVPVDVYMMVDQSLSMTAPDPSGGTRWSGVVGAITQFVKAPESAGIGVGLQYFGLGIGGLSCTASDYAKAEVEIAPLPANEPAISSSLAAHGPSSVTPTAPALQGAIQHAKDWKASHPSHTVVVLLVTDGEPDFCAGPANTGNLTTDTADVAKDGVSGSPSIQTFVLGVGTALDALNQVAAAGGTGQAYIVSSASGVAASVVAQLNKIRGAAANPCEFTIPAADPGTTFDYTQVNAFYETSTNQDQIIYNTPDASKCNDTDPAWYYDVQPTATTSPTKIILCDATCKLVTQSDSPVTYQLHCPTKEAPIH